MAKELSGHMALCVAARQLRCGSTQQKCLLLYYAICADKDGKFYRSFLDIYLDTGVTERTARNVNKSFEKVGILTVSAPTPGSGDSNDYHLDIEVMEKMADSMKAARSSAANAARAKTAKRQAEWRARHKVTVKHAATVAVKP